MYIHKIHLNHFNTKFMKTAIFTKVSCNLTVFYITMSIWKTVNIVSLTKVRRLLFLLKDNTLT